MDGDVPNTLNRSWIAPVQLLNRKGAKNDSTTEVQSTQREHKENSLISPGPVVRQAKSGQSSNLKGGCHVKS